MCVLCAAGFAAARAGENLRVGLFADFLVIVGDSSLYCLLSENGAVNLYRRQTVKSFNNRLVGELESL